MCQPDRIAAQIHRGIHQQARIGLGDGPPFLHGDFFMEGDTSQEGLRSVDQDLGPLDGHPAESDPLLHPVPGGGQLHLVQFGVERLPQAQPAGLHDQTGTTVRIGKRLALEFQFRNGKDYFLPLQGLRKAHIGHDLVVAAILQADEITGDVVFRDIEQHHFAGDASIVPPIEGHRRNGVGATLVVDPHGQEVVAVLEQIGNIRLKRRERTLVRHDHPPIEPDVTTQAYSGEIQDAAAAFLPGGLEMSGIPDRPFIALQFRILMIPIAGHHQPFGSVVGEFHEVGLPFRLAVQIHLLVQTRVILVHDRHPFPVQGLSPAGIGIPRQMTGRPENLPGGTFHGLAGKRQDQHTPQHHQKQFLPHNSVYL